MRLDQAEVTHLLGHEERRIRAEYETPRTPLEDLCVQMSHRHPLRFSRFMRDLRWFQRKAAKKGITL